MERVERWSAANRLGGLRRFAIAITTLNVLGYAWFGFEPSIAQPLVAVACAYATELGLELVDALASRRRPRFLGPGSTFVDFLLSAHISGLAVSMLLYANQRLAPIAFAAVAAIASKSLVRIWIEGRSRHLFNPSNLGIALTLLLFPSVGIAPPYQFTENLGEVGDWVLPGVLCCLGTLLNARFTHRLPLIAAWLTVFALQAWLRHALLGATLPAALMPMTGMAFLLFTFYMVTDPATTPENPRGQVLFGASVAAVYGLLMVVHVVFGLFFALAITSSARGLLLALRRTRAAAARARLQPVGAITAAPASYGSAVAALDTLSSASEKRVELEA